MIESKTEKIYYRLKKPRTTICWTEGYVHVRFNKHIDRTKYFKTRGVSKCCPTDEYNIQFGKALAYCRARSKASQKIIRWLQHLSREMNPQSQPKNMVISTKNMVDDYIKKDLNNISYKYVPKYSGVITTGLVSQYPYMYEGMIE